MPGGVNFSVYASDAQRVELLLYDDADAATIKTAWRRLVRELHPDHLIAAGMPPEFVAVAQERLVAVNRAHAALLGSRHRDA